MNKKLIIGLVILVVVLIGIQMSSDKEAVAPTADNTDAMNTELSSLDAIDLEADLKAMDADLESL